MNKNKTIKKFKLENFKIILILLAFALSIGLISAEATLQISSFSCSPSEVAINSVFSCTAQITNTGDASTVLNTATLYSDANDWMESSNYPQASGATINTSQSVEVVFSGLRATKSGNNGFSKIMLDLVEAVDTVSTTKVNVINAAVTVSNSASSSAKGGTVTSTAEVTAGGNVNIVLTFGVDSGGCSIGSQTNPVTFNGMSNGNKQSKVWTITEGTSGDCEFTVSAAATGIGGIASKIDSTSSTITCTNCPVVTPGSSSSSGSGGGEGGGGSGAKTYIIGELSTGQSVELLNNERVSFNISGTGHTLVLKNYTETTAEITVESKKQTFVIIVGNSINVDLNEDGNSEMSVKLKSINIITKKVELILTRISGGVPTKSVEKIQEEKAGEKAGEVLSVNTNKLLWIGIIIFAILAIGSIAYYIIKKRKSFKRQW